MSTKDKAMLKAVEQLIGSAAFIASMDEITEDMKVVLFDELMAAKELMNAITQT